MIDVATRSKAVRRLTGNLGTTDDDQNRVIAVVEAILLLAEVVSQLDATIESVVPIAGMGSRA